MTGQDRCMRVRRVFLGACTAVVLGFGSAWAQIVVTDPSTTARNATVAVLKNQILHAVSIQRDRLRDMAQRLSVDIDLRRYAAPKAPLWEMHQGNVDSLAYGSAYRAALESGDAIGDAYLEVVRTRQTARDALAELSPLARGVVSRALATLDAADSANVVGTHQVGLLRARGTSEQRTIDVLESDVIDSSDAQSATAVLDKISAGVLLEAHQKQARLQYLTSIVEQLVIDNKRARDTEAAVLNMQLHRLRLAPLDEDSEPLLAGVADELRTWRQP